MTSSQFGNLELFVKKQRAKEYAKEYGLKITKRYLYAFRNHDKYGRGIHSLINTYSKGQYYKDWHCDANPNNESSFGFGIFPEGNTPVRVKLEDFCLEVNNSDGKARVMGFEIV